MRNIFLALEEYIITPTDELAEEIKEISQLLVGATVHEVLRSSGKTDSKEIAADEYQPLLMTRMEVLAKEAYLASPGRFIRNATVTPLDPHYIFRLTEAQQILIYKLIGSATDPRLKRSPDGIIFAYNGYIERRRKNNEISQYTYCSSVESCIRDENTRLLKTASSFDSPVKEALCKVYEEISTCVNSGVEAQMKDLELKERVEEVLKDVEDKFKGFEYSDTKLVIKNFLYALSIVGLLYLHKTSETRGSFWLSGNLKDSAINPFEEKLHSAAPGA